MLPYSPQYVLQHYFSNVQHSSPMGYVGQGMMPPPVIPTPITTASSFNQFTATARAGSRAQYCSPSPVSGSPDFVQGSSSDGRSVSSSSSSNKRKRCSGNDEDEDEPRLSDKKPRKRGQKNGQKKGNTKPPQPLTDVLLPCLVIGCTDGVCFLEKRDRNRHMDTRHFPYRFECLGCHTFLCRLDVYRRHADMMEKKGNLQCLNLGFKEHPPAWYQAKTWKYMYFPERTDPLYEDAVKLLGRRG